MLSPYKQQLPDTDSLSRISPHNTEAEQALLGALLVNNEHLNKIVEFLLPEHFYEPVHGRIYDAILRLNDKGMIATPITLKNYFDRDEGLAEVGGAEYLLKLTAMAAVIIDVRNFGQIIYDLARKRQLIIIGEDMVNGAYNADVDESAADQIEKAEQNLFNMATEGANEKTFQHLRVSLAESLHKAGEALKSGSKITGISTGFNDLNEILGGLQQSDLVILAGRPSMGKTAFAINIAINACEAIAKDTPEDEQPGAVGVFSLEMSSEQIAARILSLSTGVNSTKIRRGDLNDDEFRKLVNANTKLLKLPLHIDDTPALSISAVRTRARRMKRKHNLKMLVVDYLQLLHGSDRSASQSRVLEISEITQGLKTIAKELNIPVLALSQLSRAVEQREDKRPQLSDLRESGSIEQDADVVMFIFREEYYLGRQMPREGTEAHTKWLAEMEAVHNITEIIVAKQRNGPIGIRKLRFDSNTTSFSNFAEEF